MRKLRIVPLLMLVFAGGYVAPSYALDLSLNDAVARVSRESNDLKKAVANVDKAVAQLDAVNANRWFKLDATAAYSNTINVEDPSKPRIIEIPAEITKMINEDFTDGFAFEYPDNMFTATVNLTQPIYTFGKIGNAVKSVKSAIKMAESSHELTKREVAYAAANLYWTAKMTDEIVKLSESDLKNARAARKRLTAAGRANRSNLVKIESDIASKEINLSDAKFNRETAHRMLKIMAGINLDEELVLTDSFPAQFGELSAPAKLEKTPEWEILSEQVSMYERLSRAQRANGYPTLAATASYSYYAIGNEFSNMFDAKGSQSASAGLALQVPIFSGGLNRANATIEAMNAVAAREDLDKSKKLTSEKYDNALKQYNHLRGNLAKLQEARDLAAKAYQFSQDRFGAGQTSAVELADVAAGLYQLDMALLNMKYNILMSEQSVKKLGE